MRIDATITIHHHDAGPQLDRLEKSLDELTKIIKGQQIDQAQVAELTRRLNAQSSELEEAMKKLGS